MGVKVRFYDCTEYDNCTYLECNLLLMKEKLIGIRIEDTNNNIPILLDKATAIRLVKELRKLISEIK